MSSRTRRSFLVAGTGAVAGTKLLSSAVAQQRSGQYAVDDQLAFGGQTRRLKLTNRDQCITSLIFSTDYPTHFRLKPELYPVCTPSGIPVTDTHQYCFIHHQSIMTGHGKIQLDGDNRYHDFYRQLPYPDSDRNDPFHKSHNLFQMGPSGIQKITDAKWEISDRITLKLTIDWQSREQKSEGGDTLIHEQRHYDIYQRDAFTIIDQFSQLLPAYKSFTMHADRHSFVGVRVHDLIDPDEGGRMLDSEGRINPDGNYLDNNGDRKAPLWIDCTGRIGDNKVGITLISHPANLRNEFYCRGWGLMICSATLGQDVHVSNKTPFRFATRYVAHDGELSIEETNKLHHEFAQRKLPFA